MSLKGFMQSILEQDESDVVYSPKPEDEVRILPPTNNREQVEVIKKDEKTEQIKVLSPSKEENKKNNEPVSFKPLEKKKITFVIPKKIEKQVEEVREQRKTETQKVVSNKQEDTQLSEFDKIELLFKESGTPEIKKAIWKEIYQKALASKARNHTSDTIRSGRFYISMNDEILLLPKYDMRNKTADEIFQDKWLKN